MTRTSLNADWIFFDLDGTLWDHESAWRASLHKTCEELSLPAELSIVLFEKANRRMWKELATSTNPNFEYLRRARWEEILRGLGRNDLLPNADAISHQHISHYLSLPRLLPGVEETIPALARHARLAIATNGFHRTQDVKFSHMGELCRHFEFVFCPDDCGALKDNPAFYDRAATRAGAVDSQRLVMIGDSWHEDVAMPVSRGWRAVWLSGGKEAPEQLPGVEAADSLENLFTLLAR